MRSFIQFQSVRNESYQADPVLASNTICMSFYLGALWGTLRVDGALEFFIVALSSDSSWVQAALRLSSSVSD